MRDNLAHLDRLIDIARTAPTGAVHTFHIDGHFVILDTESLALHTAERICYDLLCALAYDHDSVTVGGDDLHNHTLPADGTDHAMCALQQQYGAEAVDEAAEALVYLHDEGLLFTPTEPQQSFAETGVKALCLHMAEGCNLRCSYCFAANNIVAGALMDTRTARAALDFLMQHAITPTVEVDFFGGEPLLCWDTIVDAVAYGKRIAAEHGKRIRFTLTTNATLLDGDQIAFINREIYNIVLSLDGRPDVHDRYRLYANGRGSYADALGGIQRLLQDRDGLYYVRGTYTRHNLDFHNDARHMADLGLKHLSLEPVVDHAEIGVTLADVPAIRAAYREIANDVAEGKYNFFHMQLDLSGGPCKVRRTTGCGAGNAYAAVTPNGDLYPCHQFIGDETRVMGNVHSGAFAPDLSFAAANVYTKPDCAVCWARYYCSGGCHATVKHDLHATEPLYCAIMRSRIEYALANQAKVRSSE